MVDTSTALVYEANATGAAVSERDREDDQSRSRLLHAVQRQWSAQQRHVSTVATVTSGGPAAVRFEQSWDNAFAVLVAEQQRSIAQLVRRVEEYKVCNVPLFAWASGVYVRVGVVCV